MRDGAQRRGSRGSCRRRRLRRPLQMLRERLLRRMGRPSVSRLRPRMLCRHRHMLRALCVLCMLRLLQLRHRQ